MWPSPLRQGIVSLSELLGRLEELAQVLALKPLEAKRLRKVRWLRWAGDGTGVDSVEG